jgi:hypothetical protein
VKPDGMVKDAIRMAIGYWESKDQHDNLNEEIEKKFARGYPNDNIIFEDSQTAVLYQNGDEVLRVSMRSHFHPRSHSSMLWDDDLNDWLL